MSVLKAKTVTHSFAPKDVAILIANDLGVNINAIKVDFIIQEVGGDDRFNMLGTPTVTEISVTIDELKNTK